MGVGNGLSLGEPLRQCQYGTWLNTRRSLPGMAVDNRDGPRSRMVGGRAPRLPRYSVNQHAPVSPMHAARGPSLRGSVRAPGDKSISHRALILGTMTVGETRISGLLEGEDVLNTAAAMR